MDTLEAMRVAHGYLGHFASKAVIAYRSGDDLALRSAMLDLHAAQQKCRQATKDAVVSFNTEEQA